MTTPLAAVAIGSFQAEDRAALIDLWRACDLLRPWNDPIADIERAVTGLSSKLFVARNEAGIVGSVMVGYDGHRGWVYYLAVAPKVRRSGLGQSLMHKAENWLKARGAPKVQLMVREENTQVRDFYAAIGYEPNSCALVQKWFKKVEAPQTGPTQNNQAQSNQAPTGQARSGQTQTGRTPPAAGPGQLKVTITYLEMRAAPAAGPRHPPPGQQVALLKAAAPTVHFYRYLYDTVGAPWLWWERRLLTDQALAEILQDEKVELFVLYADGVPAGFAELDRRKGSSLELAYFGLIPEFVGRGLGPFLLQSAVDIAWAHEPDRLIVNTCTLDHPAALPLYQKVGFRPFKRETLVYDDPKSLGIFG